MPFDLVSSKLGIKERTKERKKIFDIRYSMFDIRSFYRDHIKSSSHTKNEETVSKAF
jgi:hypothetical protein